MKKPIEVEEFATSCGFGLSQRSCRISDTTAYSAHGPLTATETTDCIKYTSHTESIQRRHRNNANRDAADGRCKTREKPLLFSTAVSFITPELSLRNTQTKMRIQLRRGLFNAVRALNQQLHSHSASTAPHSTPRNPTSFLQSLIFLTSRFYSTESPTQLSPDLVRIMEQRLSAIEYRTKSLENFINQPEASPAEFSRANKELRKLRDSMELIIELRAKQKEIQGLRSLLGERPEDKEMLDMANEELSQTTEEERRLQNLLLQSLLPKDDADERDCILEVRAGTGGEEASLFAMDVFKMYERYSHMQGWKFEVVDITESDVKGYKEASAAISGAGVFGKLKFESGIHRVQRVPVTEKSGRVHTSAVSVAILPQANEVDVQLRNEDLKIDTYRSGGPGGQHANTTDSAVRITHLPTGLVVSIQDERSQHKNKTRALKVLCAKLYEMERSRIQISRSKLRSEQIGSGDRSERIRTYNFPQGRVTDHRVGITHHAISDVMQGESLDVFIDGLLLQQEMDAIASFSSTE